MMISRIDVSLSVRPDFEQVRLQSFEVAAQRFQISFHVFLGTISILQQKGQSSSPVERNQGLDNVVTTDDGFVIGTRELKHGLSPQLRRVIEFASFESRDSLQFGKGRRGED